ncbi:MAG: GatB/YqeY domain-containing protein, partial [Winogradskyella sp.]|nr:GatB/YqeY domain-containing protein [Winogradskyella sp.]
PEQLDESAITAAVEKVIADTGAEGMKDMGKVMGIVNKQLAGQADGKTISTIVKEKLMS